MMRRMIHNTILLLSIMVICGTGYAHEGTGYAPMSADGAVTDATNIHYTGRYCDECHEKNPEPGTDAYLKYNGNFTQLCRCHNYKPGEYTHPVDIAPSEKKMSKIPSSLPLYNGVLSCRTCHEISLQCKDDPEQRIINRRFIRGAPYQTRTDLCFKCHDEYQYSKHDPHKNQLDETGRVVEKKCLYCHIEKPDELRESFTDVQLIGDLLVLCKRCHATAVKHPANADHMVLPPLEILAMMKNAEKKFDIVLPLDNDGKIFCATCHNPHQRGVIPSARFGARGASEDYRQRLPGIICMACHKK